MMPYEITSIGGNCPVEAEGLINGIPFYFRSRGEHWSFRVADRPDGDPVEALGFYYEEEYGAGETFSAGWMEKTEAIEFIKKGASLYEEEMEKVREARKIEPIRFIDLGKQIAVDEHDPDWPRQFAFFDTVPSRFVDLGGYVVFGSYGDFMECCQVDENVHLEFINRLIELMPDWAKTIQDYNPRSSTMVDGI